MQAAQWLAGIGTTAGATSLLLVGVIVSRASRSGQLLSRAGARVLMQFINDGSLVGRGRRPLPGGCAQSRRCASPVMPPPRVAAVGGGIGDQVHASLLVDVTIAYAGPIRQYGQQASLVLAPFITRRRDVHTCGLGASMVMIAAPS